MRYATVLALLGGLVACTSAVADECVDVNLVLAVDSSHSIDPQEWDLQMRGYKQAFSDTEIIERMIEGPCGGIAVTLVRWGGEMHQYQEIPWTIIRDPLSAMKFADQLGTLPVRKLFGTAIFTAINFSMTVLETAPVKGEKWIIDVSGDGEDRKLHMHPFETCNRAKSMGIVVNGLPIVNDRPDPDSHPFVGGNPWSPEVFSLPLDLYYERMVICGPGAFIEVAEGFEDFGEAFKRKLRRELVATIE